MRKKSRERTVTCLICESEFKTNHSQGKYCSLGCREQGNRNSWNKYTKNNKEKRKAFSDKYYQNNKEKINTRIRAYQKTEKGKAVQRKTDLKQKELYPEKYQARQKLYIAVKGGKISKKPCVECGDKKVEAHHEDYSKPLDVVWLCRKCHVAKHKK